MNLRMVQSALGLVLMGLGVIILSPVAVAVVEREYSSILPFVVAAVLSFGFGLFCHWRGGWQRDFNLIRRNEGLLVVTLTWLACGLVAAIPYLFYGLHPLDALFEAISGITTTGATILVDFSRYPKDFFFWRSLTQWLGGMGIIVLFIAILPQFAVAGRRLFFAEAPGPTEEKLTPRITHTAKALWLVYVLLTLLEIGCLLLAGMDPFDAVCNSLSTMAAGGFSPHPQSIMGYGSGTVTWVVCVFMLLAGANFALQYRFLVQGRPTPLWRSEEFRLYLLIIFAATAVLSWLLLVQEGIPAVPGVRDSLFQVLSIITTTGFSSTDFALWSVAAQMVLLAMMFVGGCAGSAGGGIKVVRILFMGKYLRREITQILHPQAVLPLKIDRVSVAPEIQRQILGFLLFYLVLTLASALLVSMIEGNATLGFVGTAATIGNIGPGFGEIGPMGSFSGLHWLTKVIFIIDMIVGRLELIPLLVMLHPHFWRGY